MKISRRDLLHAGLLGAGVVVLGGVYESLGKPDVLTAPTFGKLIDDRKAAGDKQSGAATGGSDYVAGLDNFIYVVLIQSGADEVQGSTLRAWLTPTSDPNATLTPVGPIRVPWYRYTKPDGAAASLPQGLNAFRYTFPAAGTYTLIADNKAGTRYVGSSPVSVVDKSHAATLVPGQKALASQTPTTTNNQGVNPICTRTPPCDMHAISLADAISSGKPTALYFGTPAYCKSRNCGPSLEELIQVQAAVGTKANFIHVEILANADPTTVENYSPTSPTVDQWMLPSDPWLFLIDKTGVISTRYEGGFTQSIVMAGLQPLL